MLYRVNTSIHQSVAVGCTTVVLYGRVRYAIWKYKELKTGPYSSVYATVNAWTCFRSLIKTVRNFSTLAVVERGCFWIPVEFRAHEDNSTASLSIAQSWVHGSRTVEYDMPFWKYKESHD